MTRYLPSRLAISCLALLIFAGVARSKAASDNFVASADNTLYESDSGALSNGAGIHCYAGRTNMAELRRAVLRFDLSSIPAGALITEAALSLELTQEPAGAGPVVADLHRLTADWGEGDSDAGSPGGSGTGAAAGDATWIHTFSPGSLWNSPGGDFVAAASASQTVDDDGIYTWTSTPALVADVQAWVDGSAGNFGWILRGDETTDRTARRFATHETVSSQPPTLTVTYFEAVFADGFESGDLTAWSAVVP
jgi:hypothetical protein